MESRFFNMSDGVLHRAGEGVHRNGLGRLGGVDGSLGSFHDALALQSGDLHHLAAQLTGQLRDVDLIAVLADHVHHVDGNHHRNAQLGQLRGQVQVALQVGTIDQVQDGVGALGDQIIPGYDLLQRVRRERINAGQVHDDDVVMLLETSFLLFHRNAGPVTNELIRTGQGIEQRRFTAVRVARQGDLNGHEKVPPSS